VLRRLLGGAANDDAGAMSKEAERGQQGANSHAGDLSPESPVGLPRVTASLRGCPGGRDASSGRRSLLVLLERGERRERSARS